MMVKARAVMEKREAVVSYRMISTRRARAVARRGRRGWGAYPDEGPRGGPMIVGEMPDEVAHDGADDQARDELEEADRVEGDAWVVRRGGAHPSLEGTEHGGGQGRGDDVGGGGGGGAAVWAAE